MDSGITAESVVETGKAAIVLDEMQGTHAYLIFVS
jgi:hypothetical protein